MDSSYECLIKNYETREKEIITYDEYKKIITGDYDMGLLQLKRIVQSSDKHLYVYKEENEDVDYIEIIRSRMVGGDNENIISYKL